MALRLLFRGQAMLPSASAMSVAVDRIATSPRVLVLRSCRPHVLDDALAAFRQQRPDAHFVALTHAGHQAALRRQGIGQAIEVPGNRFGLLKLPIRIIRAIRAERFDTVLVPVMMGGFAYHLNLICVAILTRARQVVFYSPERGLEERTHARAVRDLPRAAVIALMRRFDLPAALMLMAYAIVAPRRRRARSARPRRVLHVISSWGVGGAQRQLAELIQHYPADYTADIFVLSDDGNFSTQHLRGHHVTIRSSSSWPFLSLTILEIARLCRDERYDIVHTWLFKANVLGVTAARLAGVTRVISSVRNLSLWKREWDHQPWFRLADTLASHASDVVTVNGRSLVADHASWARMRRRDIAVVPNGLSLDGLDLDRAQAHEALRKALGLPPTTRLVGTVGRLAHEKDHHLLLDAWFRASMPHAHLVIVGDGPLKFALQSRIDESGAAVTLLGSSSRARELMAGLDLFVLPSRIEGFPNVLLEATMLGVPVLATDVGAARDMVCDDDDLVPVADAETLAARLISHLRNLDGARRRASVRKEFVRRSFTVDRMVHRWLALYDGAD